MRFVSMRVTVVKSSLVMFILLMVRAVKFSW